MEENRKLYWKYFKVWIVGILISFPVTVTFGYVTKEMHSNMTLPLSLTILFFPLVIVSFYGFRHGFCPAYRYGFVYRGRKARFWNTVPLIYYCGIILLEFY